MICKHASSGCNYPEGECLGSCMDNSYRMNFTLLGEPVQQQPSPLRISDLLILALFFLCLGGLVSGIFSGAPL